MALSPVAQAIAEAQARDILRKYAIHNQINTAMESGPWAMEAIDIEARWDELIELDAAIAERRWSCRAVFHPWLAWEISEEAARLVAEGFT